MNLLLNIFLVLQQEKESIDKIIEKRSQAEGAGYDIGLTIGAYLPIVLLMLFAYLMYAYSKKRREREEE